MSFEDESMSGGYPARPVTTMTLEKAVEMGEYDPDHLIVFPEWNMLSQHLQWTYISRGLENRRQFLTIQWSKIANSPDYSKKPHLLKAQRGIEKQLSELQLEEDRLAVEYLG